MSSHGLINPQRQPFDEHRQHSTTSAASSRRLSSSKITVEYHRPSRESIQEYNDLLADANLAAAAAATAANYTSYQDPYAPSRQAPPPPSAPSAAPSAYHPKTPTDTTAPRHRNSLQKPRKGSIAAPLPPSRIDIDPFAAGNATKGTNDMTSPFQPPRRPSRANTATLNDVFPEPILERRLSSPVVVDKSELPIWQRNDLPATPNEFNDSGHYGGGSTFSSPAGGTVGKARSGSTAGKTKKGMLGFMSDFLNTTKRPEISTPYDPVHLTHVGFNTSTGEFTGLPKEWQQLLQESGISRTEQEKNPQAVMEIVKFYQEGGGDVWDKMAPAGPSHEQPQVPPPLDPGFFSPVSIFIIVQLKPLSNFRHSVQRAAPAPPKKITASSISGPISSAVSTYRPAPAPPTTSAPALDRSTSQRAPTKPKADLGRSNTSKTPSRPGTAGAVQPTIPKPLSKPSPKTSQTDLRQATPRAVPDPRAIQANQAPSPAAAQLAKAAGGTATPRRREKKPVDKEKEIDIVNRLKQICTDADPTRLYRNLVKIGQGWVTNSSTMEALLLNHGCLLQRFWWCVYRVPSRHEPLGRDQADGPRKAAEEGSHHQRDSRHALLAAPQYR